MDEQESAISPPAGGSDVSGQQSAVTESVSGQADGSGVQPTLQVTPQTKIPIFLFCVFIALVIAVIFFFLTRRSPSTDSARTSTELSRTSSPQAPTNPSASSGQAQPVSTTSAATNSDLPPLYTGIQWEEPVKEEVSFHDENFNVISFDGTSIISKPLEAYPIEFINYYKTELQKRGWVETSVAGYPEDDGGFYEFKKGSRYMLFGVRTFEGDKAGRALIQYN